MVSTLLINEMDNVVVAVHPVKKGSIVDAVAGQIVVQQDIDQGHKIAIRDIKQGENIIKYGFPIGHAVCDIHKGEWVHTHNVKTNLGEVLNYEYHPHFQPLQKQPARTFLGYPRKDGSVGIRNEIWIIPTVGCVNAIAQNIAKEAQQFVAEGLEGVYTFVHPFGCSQMGDDLVNTQKTLAGLVHHPNAAGVLVLSLGCENNTQASFKEVLGEYDPERVRFVQCQDEEDELAAALGQIKELAQMIRPQKRVEVSADKLVVGLKCGGSDGFSGITANPMVGVFSDMLVAQGGTTVLTEVPEMFGAETLLMDRCKNREIFEKTVHLINDFKEYFISHNQVIYENPSPGNKKGGITTLEDKSLGCVQKGGKAPVSDVLKHAERVHTKGLNLLSAPGNDLIASTALTVSGCHMVLFTTGRGTPFGAPAPTVKISTNTELFHKKGNWIDFNAGDIVNGESIQDAASRFFDYILQVASGKRTRAEENNAREIAIFKHGVSV